MPNTDDFDLKYRPRTLDDVIGQEAAVSTIRGFGLVVPRCILFSGAPGTGKTTMARIISDTLLGVPEGSMDLAEKNCGVVESPIAMAREINSHMSAAPLEGKKRVWILDEVQTLSRQKASQEALLKVLEDCPQHVQFFLCTTDPQRLLKAIRTRCVEIAVKPLKATALAALIDRVATAELIGVSSEVRARIIEGADGSARTAIKALQKIAGLEGTPNQLAALEGFGEESEVFALVKAVLFGSGPNWTEIAKQLVEHEEEAPEGLRQMIVATARSMLLKGNKPKLCYKVIECLAEPMYDQSSGKALLAARLWEICNSK